MRADSTVTEDKLEVTCTGSFQRAEIMNVIDAIDEARTQNPQVRKCLIDFTGAEFNLGGVGEFLVGEYAARKLSGLRVSVQHNRGQINKLMENAAFNRGLRIQLADSREEALDWLEK